MTTCAACGCTGAVLCARCIACLTSPPDLPPPAGVDHLVSLTSHEGVGRALVLAHKRGAARGALDLIARALVGAMGAVGIDPSSHRAGGLDVTWAPTTPSRRRRAGRDHAQDLAAAVAAVAGQRPVHLLARRQEVPQQGRSRIARLSGPTFAVLGRPAGTVVLVDDVVTTGATMARAAAVLRAAGARQIIGATMARTARTPATRSDYPRSLQQHGGGTSTAAALGASNRP